MIPTLKIAIDGNEANVSNRVGSNVYAFEILTQVEKITKNQPRIKIVILLAQEPTKDMPPAREGWTYQILKPSLLWTQMALPAYLFLHQDEYQVFYTPGHYAPRLTQLPYVSSVMDLGFLKFPEQFKTKDLVQLRDWTAYSVEHASKVIAISESTKNDVEKTYHRSAKDVIVTYPDIDSSIHPVAEAIQTKVLKKLKITSPYILYVGTLQPRKNIIRVIEAFEQVHQVISNPTNRLVPIKSKYTLRDTIPFKDIQLVLAGKVGWLADDILKRVESSPLKDKIIVTGYIDSQTKNALYQGASTSILVGLYEGFGIPALESLAHGVIPVVSNTSSLPEVIGKAGIQVTPTSTAAIKEGLLTLLFLTAKERAKLRREARKQVQSFSWLKSAQIILDTLNNIATKT